MTSDAIIRAPFVCDPLYMCRSRGDALPPAWQEENDAMDQVKEVMKRLLPEINSDDSRCCRPVDVLALDSQLTQKVRFQRLADKWRRETSHWSNFAHRAEHHAYQEIMAMGDSVIPLLLTELEKRPADWFWALYHMTKANPVPSGDQGHQKKMADAWLKWGKAKGFIA